MLTQKKVIVNIVQFKLIENLTKKIESYEKEIDKLRLRIDLLSSDYPKELENKIIKQQKLLDSLLNQHDKKALLNDIPDEEKIFSKEIQNENDLKAYYEKKNEEYYKQFEKNHASQVGIGLKIIKFQQEYKDLKAELKELNKNKNDFCVKSEKLLKNNLKFNENKADKQIKRLQTKEEILKNQLRICREEECALQNLLTDISSMFSTPHYRYKHISFRSSSQTRTKYHQSPSHMYKRSSKSIAKLSISRINNI